MDWLVQIVVWLQGKKTYIVCASAILTALIAYLNKSISLTEFIAAVYAAVTGVTLKAGQARGKGPPPASTTG